MVIPNEPRVLFLVFCFFRGRIKNRSGYLLIWHVIVWSTWKVDNDVIINKVTIIVKKEEEKSIVST